MIKTELYSWKPEEMKLFLLICWIVTKYNFICLNFQHITLLLRLRIKWFAEFLNERMKNSMRNLITYKLLCKSWMKYCEFSVLYLQTKKAESLPHIFLLTYIPYKILSVLCTKYFLLIIKMHQWNSWKNDNEWESIVTFDEFTLKLWECQKNIYKENLPLTSIMSKSGLLSYDTFPTKDQGNEHTFEWHIAQFWCYILS